MGSESRLLSAKRSVMNDQVPIEYIGRARALREKISKDEIRYSTACNGIIAPLRPRQAWPTDRVNRNFLSKLARAYAALRSPCRLLTTCQVTNDGGLKISDLRAAASTITFPGWAVDEPSIQISYYQIEAAPFAERSLTMAELGQHSIGRRFQRGRPNTDDSVLDDLVEILGGFANAMRNSDVEFAIPTRSGGRWLGMLSPDHTAIAIRTYVE
jgi:hypothetical protein